MDERLLIKETLNDYNKLAIKNGLAEIQLVNPKDCLGQAKNARYFSPEVFTQLVENVKSDGRLESVPLVYRDTEKFRIISGHHRIEAAKQAGLEFILVMVISPKDRDEIISKQLSHNSLVGKDDKVILNELFEEIKNIQQKMASGLSSEIEKISYTSLNFKLGSYKEFILLFCPGDESKFDNVMSELEKEFSSKKDSSTRIVPIELFDRFADCLRKIKKNENIKSNPVGFLRLVEIAENYLKEDEKAHYKTES